MTQTTTLRATARELVSAEAVDAAKLSHARNHHKLNIHRDGTINWFESINASDDVIDRFAGYFCAVRSVITVGTGSYACNCDHCEDSGYESINDAIADAAHDAAYDVEQQLLNAFDEIPVGYFDDEDAQ